VDEIHDHASGLDAVALIKGAYRNLHNLFDKHMPLVHRHSNAQCIRREALHEPRRDAEKHDLKTHRYRLNLPIKTTFCLENARMGGNFLESMINRPQLLIEQVAAILPCWLLKMFHRGA
jgi:hypothetical protein